MLSDDRHFTSDHRKGYRDSGNERRRLELLYDLETDNEVKRYVGGGTLSRPKQDWIERMRQLRVTHDALLPLIVTCIRRFEIQVIIAKQYWGKRLGKEAVELLMGVAFNNLNALSVVSVVHPENNPSLKLYQPP